MKEARDSLNSLADEGYVLEPLSGLPSLTEKGWTYVGKARTNKATKGLAASAILGAVTFFGSTSFAPAVVADIVAIVVAALSYLVGWRYGAF